MNLHFSLISIIHFFSLLVCVAGIVAVLFCGFTQAKYTVHNLSEEGKTRTKQVGL